MLSPNVLDYGARKESGKAPYNEPPRECERCLPCANQRSHESAHWCEKVHLLRQKIVA